MRVSSSIPFSRSIVLTASMISLLISSLPFQALLPFVDEVAPHDLAVRDLHALAVGDDERQVSVVRGGNRAAELLSTVQLVLRPYRDGPADRVAEVCRRPQRPLDPGRGEVDGVPVEVAAEQARHALAEGVVAA